MGILDDIKSSANSALSGIRNEFSKHMNRKVMTATLAGLALVTAANGEMKDSELEALFECLGDHEALKAYDPVEMQEIFNGYYDKLTGRMKIAGRAKILNTVKDNIKPGSSEAITMVAIAVEIASADGDFDKNEKKEVLTLCEKVGVDPYKDLGVRIIVA